MLSSLDLGLNSGLLALIRVHNMNIAPLSEMAIASLVDGLLRERMAHLSVEERGDPVAVVNRYVRAPKSLPVEVQKRMNKICCRTPGRLGHWIVWVNRLSLVRLIPREYVASGMAKAVIEGRMEMVAVLMDRMREEHQGS